MKSGKGVVNGDRHAWLEIHDDEFAVTESDEESEVLRQAPLFD